MSSLLNLPLLKRGLAEDGDYCKILLINGQFISLGKAKAEIFFLKARFGSLKEEALYKAFSLCRDRAFSHDVTAAMLVYQNKETAATLAYQADPPRIDLCFYANTFFCFIKPIWPLVTWEKTL